MRRAAGACIAAALAATACGPAPAASPTPPPAVTASASASATAATPTPAPQHSVIVLLQRDSGTLLFVRDDGTALGSKHFASATSTMTAWTTAAGRFWYIGDADHRLHSVTSDGHDTDVAPLAETAGNLVNGLAVNGDGSRWAWGIQVQTSAGPTRTHVDIAGPSGPPRMILDEPSNNPVLSPLAWTARGLVVSRNATGIGGCCYLTPETAGRDAMLVDATTFKVVETWSGCATASASEQGSVACVESGSGGAVVVHRAAGADVTVYARTPVEQTGWTLVDDARSRVIFAVVHSSGAGGSDGPYVIDTEAGDLGTRAVSRLFDQTTPDAVLPDGTVVASTAPPSLMTPSQAVIRTAAGGTRALGPVNAEVLGAFPLAG